PLDMRFDPDRPGPTAAELVARTPQPQLAALFAELGEIRGARRLARVICEERAREPIRTTGRLAEIVRRALPARPAGRSRIDPATQAFQALRIAVNDELGRLERALDGLVDLLAPGGRIAVISFHSLEDRIVKRTLRRLAAGGEPSPITGQPTAEPVLELGTRRPLRPSEDEIAANPRARSARLRWGIRR
ncbi:MAG: 16S rRNA (cytosine(1402)-N(4))-methyltransferase, partial [Acidobacteria bacterium]